MVKFSGFGFTRSNLTMGCKRGGGGGGGGLFVPVIYLKAQPIAGPLNSTSVPLL